MTPHISAKKGEIAKNVLMPGDPLRAKFIAKTFLTNVKQVNSIRNMFMYTGLYKGKEVSICASGMGNPSMGIYSNELFKFYDVENIIRVGSAGSYLKDLKVGDVVLCKETYSEDSFMEERVLNQKINTLKPSEELNSIIEKVAKEDKIILRKERVHCLDLHYDPKPIEEIIKETKCACVEMESKALLIYAKLNNKKATCLLTISNNLITQDYMSSKQREKSFLKMIKLALDSSLLI